MRISDWSSDVCSSDLARGAERVRALDVGRAPHLAEQANGAVLGDDAGARAGEEGQRLRTPLLAHPLELGCDLVQRLVPAYRLEAAFTPFRSEARRGGKECVSPCGSLWSPSH